MVFGGQETEITQVRFKLIVEYKNYKSTITHSQAIMAAARLSILTGDKSYAAQGDMMYNWVKKYIVKSTGPTGTLPGLHVFDGNNSINGRC